MYRKILKDLNQHNVLLVAVSKTRPKETIQSFYDLGQRNFGENKVQELVLKHDSLPKDINWHMIGHLQSNKVKYIVPFIHLIHSVDSLKLATKINSEAKKIERVIDILIQIEISDEDSKFGWSYHDVVKHVDTFNSLEHIRIVGFMGMAKNTHNVTEIRKEFASIKYKFDLFKSLYLKDYFTNLSIGMSSDYNIAVEEGATMVRIGSLLFGNRKY